MADVCADREAGEEEGGFDSFSIYLLCFDPSGNGSEGFFPVVVVVVLLPSWVRGGKEGASRCEEEGARREGS